MNTPTRNQTGRITILLVSLVVLAGCSGTEDTGEKDETAPNGVRADTQRPELDEVCAVFAEVNTAAAAAKSPKEGLSLLKELADEVTPILTDAPESINKDASIIAAAVQRAVDSDDLTQLTKNRVANAGARIASQCQLTLPDGRDTP